MHCSNRSDLTNRMRVLKPCSQQGFRTSSWWDTLPSVSVAYCMTPGRPMPIPWKQSSTIGLGTIFWLNQSQVGRKRNNDRSVLRKPLSSIWRKLRTVTESACLWRPTLIHMLFTSPIGSRWQWQPSRRNDNRLGWYYNFKGAATSFSCGLPFFSSGKLPLADVVDQCCNPVLDFEGARGSDFNSYQKQQLLELIELFVGNLREAMPGYLCRKWRPIWMRLGLHGVVILRMTVFFISESIHLSFS